MKKIEYVYREILYNAIEKKNRRLTQLELARTLKISLSTVNHAIKHLKKMQAVETRTRSFVVLDPKKVLYYWASIRDLDKDIIFQTRVEKPILQIEKEMPDSIVYGAYTAYKFIFNDVPADYSEVYIYGQEDIKDRFPKSDNNPNLFVLKKDSSIQKYGKATTIAQTFVDLWNIKTWYANEFLKIMEERIDAILE